MAEGMGMEDVSSCETQNLENMDLAPFKMKKNMFLFCFVFWLGG